MSTVKSPRLVVKVAAQVEVLEMQSGGALVNQTRRFVSWAVGQVGATAADWSEVVVVVVELVVVVVSLEALFLPCPLEEISTTMRTMAITRARRLPPRRRARRRFAARWAWARFS
jgi:hypothetical protein